MPRLLDACGCGKLVAGQALSASHGIRRKSTKQENGLTCRAGLGKRRELLTSDE